MAQPFLTMSPDRAVVRSCTAVDDFRRMEDLQLDIWEYSERDLVPSQMFVVAAKSGGQVLGAFVNDRLVGFALAYAAIRDTAAYLHSHMVAVLPEFRDLGVGRELKLAQRREALARGIHRIEWTFDPLQVKNAYFNICRLGAIARRYVRNVYGETSSPLHAGLPTDRLVAEWMLDSSRVEGVLQGSGPPQQPAVEHLCVRIPTQDPAAELADTQRRTRESFERLFAEGYVVTWFHREPNAGVYVLTAEESKPAM